MNSSNRKFILVGASTGGPTLLEKITTALSQDFQATLILVQHMQPLPLVSFANRLKRLSKIPVVLVENGVLLEKATVYILADSAKIVKRANEFYLEMVEEKTFYHPMIDTLFSSAKILHPHKTYAYLLSGIGKDGVDGLKVLENVAQRVAQDEATSVVYGMPRAAYEAKVVEKVLPIDTIVAQIAQQGR